MGIRDSRLYRQDYGTFEDYCRERWGMSLNYTERLMTASNIIATLPIGRLPTTESQARELAPLRSAPEVMLEVWASVVRNV